MSPKLASKYHALKWLVELTRNNYLTRHGVEYNELAVAKLTAKCLDSLQIARALNIKTKNVYRYISAARHKTNSLTNRMLALKLESGEIQDVSK
jgi:DNA-binding CsgD family transcriptional regulator